MQFNHKGPQESVAGAPLPIAAVVAGLHAHLNYTVGTDAIRSLIFERYVGQIVALVKNIYVAAVRLTFPN